MLAHPHGAEYNCDVGGYHPKENTMCRVFASLTVLALVWLGDIDIAVAANVAILMPGSHGIVPGDFLVRNQGRFKSAGIRTILTASATEAADAVAAEAAHGRKVVIVGMSKGAVDAAQAITAGARPIGIVFVSGIHSRVMAALGTPDKLPATLVVHHRHDICKFTPPGIAAQFVAWTHGKARLKWIDTTGEPGSDPCNAQGAHGFFKQDGPAVAAIISFIQSH